MRLARLLAVVGTRVGHAVVTLLGIAVLNFFLLKLAPGDAASVMAGEAGGGPPEYVAALRKHLNLDQPVLVQLAHYLGNLATFDLGYSVRNGETVAALILDRLGPTLLLMGCALVGSVVLGIVLGLVGAQRVHGPVDNAISVVSLVAYAMPLFWVGLMLILVFSIWLDWLPAAGMEDVVAFYEGWDRVVDIARHLVLPTLTLSLFYVAVYARLMRAAVIDQKDMDYVTTVRAKGQTERAITLAHVFPNAVLPVVTMAGVQAGALLGGSIVVETVFAWPGLGTLAYQALFARDLNLLLGIFLLSAWLVVVVNVAVDVIYTLLDPRIGARAR